MIGKFVELFMAGKPKLEVLFSEKHPSSYKEIVAAVVTLLNDGSDEYGSPDPARIHELNDGDYQGTLVYVVGECGCQPHKYWYIRVDYGSCSGCDTLKRIHFDSDDYRPTPQQVADYMTLALHIVQGLKEMGD